MSCSEAGILLSRLLSSEPLAAAPKINIAHEWLGTPSPESAIRHLHSAYHLQPISLNGPHLQERRDTTQSTTMQAIRAEGPRGANLKFIHIARTLLFNLFNRVQARENPYLILP